MGGKKRIVEGGGEGIGHSSIRENNFQYFIYVLAIISI